MMYEHSLQRHQLLALIFFTVGCAWPASSDETFAHPQGALRPSLGATSLHTAGIPPPARLDAAPLSAQTCGQEGELTAESAAAAYCDLAIVLEGVGEDAWVTSAHEDRCARAFETACEKAFDAAATEHAVRVGEPDSDCTPFTRGSFKRAYEIARHNHCVYMPAPSREPEQSPVCRAERCNAETALSLLAR